MNSQNSAHWPTENREVHCCECKAPFMSVSRGKRLLCPTCRPIVKKRQADKHNAKHNIISKAKRAMKNK